MGFSGLKAAQVRPRNNTVRKTLVRQSSQNSLEDGGVLLLCTDRANIDCKMEASACARGGGRLNSVHLNRTNSPHQQLVCRLQRSVSANKLPLFATVSTKGKRSKLSSVGKPRCGRLKRDLRGNKLVSRNLCNHQRICVLNKHHKGETKHGRFAKE